MKLKCPASDIDAFQDDPAVIKGPSQKSKCYVSYTNRIKNVFPRGDKVALGGWVPALRVLRYSFEELGCSIGGLGCSTKGLVKWFTVAQNH